MTPPIRAVRVWGRLADPQGHRLTAPDEDEFTLAIAALEHLGERSAPTLHGVGRLPEVFRWGLSGALGRSVALCEHPPGAEGWKAALTEVAGAASTPSIVFGVDGPGHLLDSPGPWPGFGAAAFALDLREDPGLRERLLAWAPNEAPTIEAAQAIVDALAQPPGGRPTLDLAGWAPSTAGPGGADPEPSRHLERWAQRAVSEGAYMPEARYREGIASHWRLAADRCPRCSTVTFPVRGWCRGCGAADDLVQFELPRSGGRVEAVTTIGKGGQPTEFDPLVEFGGAYDVALVELAPGLRATLMVTDSPPGTVRVGDRIGTVLRRLYPMDGQWRYGLKAVLPAAREAPSPMSDP